MLRAVGAMEITDSKKDGSVVVKVCGRLDAGNAGILEHELEGVVRRGEHHIILDMESVDYISSGGVRVLIKYFQALKKLGGSFVVSNPSSPVKTVITLTGLRDLFMIPEPEPTDREKGATLSEWKAGGIQGTIFRERGGELECQLIGNPRKVVNAGFSEQDMTQLDLGRNTFALGVGAFGSDFDDCRKRFGDFVAAGGGTACLPSDGSKMPDYFIEQGELSPRINALYAMVVRGQFDLCMRFEADRATIGIRMSELVDILFEITGKDTVGVVLLAESGGLIGASMKRSPTVREVTETPFSFPEIRKWVSFSPQSVHDHTLVLTAGIATVKCVPELAPFVRPLKKDPIPLGHFHAAAFRYRVIPKGHISLHETIASVFNEQDLLGVLHLLNDDRTIEGAGESRFLRGAIWVGPIRRFISL
jgi:anti-anti-sigma factor